jgi:hypothetical protein
VGTVGRLSSGDVGIVGDVKLGAAVGEFGRSELGATGKFSAGAVAARSGTTTSVTVENDSVGAVGGVADTIAMFGEYPGTLSAKLTSGTAA